MTSFRPGDTIGHYRLIRKLGEGGMGLVYLANDEKLQREVALKFLPSELAEDPVALRRQEAEARNLARLSHPGLGAIFGMETTPDASFLVLEYIPGETLAARLRRGPLDIPSVLDLAAQIAAALDYAHGRGVIHRDIKPSNIISSGDRYVLLDLGLAVRPDATRLTLPGTMMGTPAYMSPEQAMGEELGPATDIWSFGAVLYESLTGRLPFTPENQIALINQIVNNTPPEPSTLTSTVPPWMNSLVMQCLEKEPTERPSLVSMRSALVQPQRKPVDSGAQTNPLSATPIKEASRRLLIVVGAIILIVTAGITFVLSSKRTGTPAGGASSDVLAIVDFQDLSPIADPISAAGVTDLVGISLADADSLRIVSQELISDCRRRLFGNARGPIEDAQILEVARKSGATVFLAGRIGHASNRRYATWRLVRARDGELLAGSRVEGAELTDLAEGIAGGVVAQLAREQHRVAGTTGIPRLSEMTTTSSLAYRSYVEGLLAKEADRDRAAVRAFTNAIAIDSSFAQAHFALSRSDFTVLSIEDRRAAADAAWRLRDRLGEREQKRLSAWRLVLSNDVAGTVRAYEELLSRWPDELGAYVDYATVLYTDHWCFKSCLDVIDRGLQYFPDSVDLMDLRIVALMHLDLPEALSRSRELTLAHPSNPVTWDDLGSVLAITVAPESAEVCFQRALTLDPSYENSTSWLALLPYFRGELDQAILGRERLVTADADHARDTEVLITQNAYVPGLVPLLAQAGRISEARSALSKLRDSPRQSYLLSVQGWISQAAQRSEEAREFHVQATSMSGVPAREHRWQIANFVTTLCELGETSRAREALSNLDPAAPPSDCTRRYLYLESMARIQLAETHYDSTLATLDELRSLALPWGVYTIDWTSLKAKAEAGRGRPDAAANLMNQMLATYKAYAPGYLELGEYQEAAGDPEGAIQSYRTFLAYWHAADPGLPQLRQARDRLMALEQRRTP